MKPPRASGTERQSSTRREPIGAAQRVGSEAGAPSQARLRLRTTAAVESRLRAGHPWLFAQSVREQNREGQLGELAAIYDRQDKLLAVGMFDPESPIRVRVLRTGQPKLVTDVASDLWSAAAAIK